MRRRMLAGLAVALLAIGGWGLRHEWFGTAAGADPQFVCAAEIDLGERVVNDVRDGVFTVSNAGGTPLELTHVTTDCGCMGVYQLPSRAIVRPDDTLTVQPGGRLQLALPIRAAGVHGQRADYAVRFRTNDPARSAAAVRLTYIPVARYFTVPGRVNLGEIPAGHLAVVTLDLYSSAGGDTRPVRNVVSSRPADLRALYTPHPPEASSAAGGERDGVKLGRIRVEIPATAVGTVSGEAQVFLDGDSEPSVRVPVAARVSPAAELMPDAVYLPQSSSAGPRYSAVVLCRTTGATGWAVRVGQVADGLTVRTEDLPDDPNCRRLVVTCDPARFAGSTVVPITIEAAGRTDERPLRVVVAPPK